MLVVASLACHPVSRPAATPRASGPKLGKVGHHSIHAEAFAAYLRSKSIEPRNEAELDRELERYAKRQALSRAIVDSGRIDEAAIESEVAEFRRQRTISRYFEGFISDAVANDEIEAIYREREAKYTTRRARVAQVLIRLPANADAKTQAAADERVAMIQRRIDAGDDFAEIARQFSDDHHNRSTGGELGWVREGSIDPAFSAAAFALNRGQTTGPVRSALGIHFIHMLQGPESQRVPLEQVAGKLRHELAATAKAREIERLTAQHPVELARGDWQPETARFDSTNQSASRSTPSKPAQ